MIQELNSTLEKIINNERYWQRSKKCLFIERQIRKNNILIFGLNIPDKSNRVDTVLEFLKETLEIKIEVSDINNFYILKIGSYCAIKLNLFLIYKKLQY